MTAAYPVRRTRSRCWGENRGRAFRAGCCATMRSSPAAAGHGYRRWFRLCVTRHTRLSEPHVARRAHALRLRSHETTAGARARFVEIMGAVKGGRTGLQHVTHGGEGEPAAGYGKRRSVTKRGRSSTWRVAIQKGTAIPSGVIVIDGGHHRFAPSANTRVNADADEMAPAGATTTRRRRHGDRGGLGFEPLQLYCGTIVYACQASCGREQGLTGEHGADPPHISHETPSPGEGRRAGGRGMISTTKSWRHARPWNGSSTTRVCGCFGRANPRQLGNDGGMRQSSLGCLRSMLAGRRSLMEAETRRDHILRSQRRWRSALSDDELSRRTRILTDMTVRCDVQSQSTLTRR